MNQIDFRKEYNVGDIVDYNDVTLEVKLNKRNLCNNCYFFGRSCPERCRNNIMFVEKEEEPDNTSHYRDLIEPYVIMKQSGDLNAFLRCELIKRIMRMRIKNNGDDYLKDLEKIIDQATDLLELERTGNIKRLDND